VAVKNFVLLPRDTAGTPEGARAAAARLFVKASMLIPASRTSGAAASADAAKTGPSRNLAPFSIADAAAARAPSGVPAVSLGNSTKFLTATSNVASWAASSSERPNTALEPESGSSKPMETRSAMPGGGVSEISSGMPGRPGNDDGPGNGKIGGSPTPSHDCPGMAGLSCVRGGDFLTLGDSQATSANERNAANAAPTTRHQAFWAGLKTGSG
jgi:hypothetical protein